MNRLLLVAIVVALELPAQEPTPTSIDLAQSTVCGTNVKGKVNLSGPVKTDVFSVDVTSNQPGTIEITSPVRVPKDGISASFEIVCIQGTQSKPATITARAGGGTSTATIQILAPVLQSISMQPHTGGETIEGEVRLIGRAPRGGVVVAVSSSSSHAVVPQSVTVRAGDASARFSGTVRAVDEPTTVSILGTGFGVSKTVDMVVLPPVPASVTTPGSVTGGKSATIVVTLTRKAGPGDQVLLSSSNPGVVQVPASIRFDGSSAQYSFPVVPGRVGQATTANIVATVGEVSATGSLRVLPPAINLVSLSPSTATAGQVTQLQIRLDGEAPANGFPVDITTNNPDLVRVPQGFVVPAGDQNVSVPIQVLRVERAADASITAGANGIKKNVVLKVEPEGPATVLISPTSVVGGAKATATVTRVPSPEPLTVLLSAEGNATVPASVTFGPNAASETFTITTEPVAAQSAAKITAKTGAVVRTAFLQLDPPPVTSITISPSPVTGGDTYSVNFAIARAVPAPVLVRITTYDSGGTYNYDVTIPANSTTGRQSIAAHPDVSSIRMTAGVFSPGTLRVTGIKEAFVTVNPRPPRSTQLSTAQ